MNMEAEEPLVGVGVEPGGVGALGVGRPGSLIGSGRGSFGRFNGDAAAALARARETMEAVNFILQGKNWK